jgi:hypothetical protein
MFKRIFQKLIPQAYANQLKNFIILASEYGQFKSIKRNSCIYFDSSPVPWYTYPAIEYLRNIDFTDKIVFEYGSGNSSLFWADRVKKIVSVEDNTDWFNKINSPQKTNFELLLRPTKEAYVQAIHKYNDVYDIVIIDGNHRPECARQLKNRVQGNGMVILDNSDWFKKTAKYIRDHLDFIEVDFHGFGPMNPYTTTTSVFFTRQFNFKPLKGIQPNYAIGGLKHELNREIDY